MELENYGVEIMKYVYLKLDENGNIFGIFYDEQNEHDKKIELTDIEFEHFNENMFFYKYVNNNLVYDESLKNLNSLNEKNEKVNNEIGLLKRKLTNTDYKIIKCYEAFMRQQPLPYNLEELSAQRDAWRTEINELEEELA
jgi:chaperonin cofactor prefoldin